MNKATYVTHSGNDALVVKTARASFGLGFSDQDTITPADIKLIKFLARGCPLEEWNDICESIIHVLEYEDAVKKIKDVRKMATHFAPFCHPSITLFEEMSIVVERQRMKHQIGCVYSSLSRRYKTDNIQIDTPDKWRKKPEGSIKQGSGDNFLSVENAEFNSLYKQSIDVAVTTYNHMIDNAVCPEQARGVLPLNLITNCYSTCSLYAFANAYNQRSDGHAQKEIRQLAGEWDKIIRPLYPISWAALVDSDYD